MNRQVTGSTELPNQLKQKLSLVEKSHRQCVQELLSQRNEVGHWVGKLSTSALSTATAVSALSLHLRECEVELENLPRQQIAEMIEKGAAYLLSSQNDDGGWGDTDKSYSNIATTYLCWAALHLVSSDDLDKWELIDDRTVINAAIDRAKERINDWGGITALRKRYGTDKTFVVPILTNCALAGIVSWKEVSALPFEMAWVPQRWYRFMKMPVVSYAVPALVAIGQAKFFKDPPALPLRWLREKAVQPTMEVLLRMQPASGGYLEAAPLTSFVAMSLAATGRADHPVTVSALRFLADSVLEDGSWPIDTNLATWVTSLSINALACGEVATEKLSHDRGEGSVVESPVVADISSDAWQWLLDCQYDHPHPFTGADPGGWGWTNLTGSVPDADDTPGALLSLNVAGRLRDSGQLRLTGVDLQERARRGTIWLLDLQNSDGGWPTFCRGWGKLPFDRSGVDLTAHATRALLVWSNNWDAVLRHRTEKAVLRGVRFILRQQRTDGSWLPLWFGNQDQPDDENPVYGISKTVLGLLSVCGWYVQVSENRLSSKKRGRETPLLKKLESSIQRAIGKLMADQNADGGWGGGKSVSEYFQQHCGYRAGNGAENGSEVPPCSSIEETALAVDAITAWLAYEKSKIGSYSSFLGSVGTAESVGEGDKTSLGQSFSEIAENTGRGVEFLCQRIQRQEHRNSWPIGFYFAKLWYHEELYPLIFTTAALGRWQRLWAE